MDEHILVFTDADGKLLVGNEDFQLYHEQQVVRICDSNKRTSRL
ncbi:MAG: hypothetical protein WDO71_21425 [Bacteroidota bacterium]